MKRLFFYGGWFGVKNQNPGGERKASTFMSNLQAAQCGVSEPKPVNEGIYMEG